MNRALLTLSFSLIFLFSFALAGAESLNLIDNGEKAAISLQGTPHQFSGEISLGQIEVTDNIIINGTTFKNVAISSESPTLFVGTTAVEGEAMIPTLTCYFAVPPDGEISVNINSVETTIIDDIKLAPMPHFKVVNGLETTVNRISEEYYSTDRDYPQQRFELIPGGKMRNYRIEGVTFYPAVYNPVKQSLELATSISFDVNISGGEFLDPEIDNTNKVSEAFLPIYKSHISNPELLDDVDPMRGGYWVIIHDNYYDDFIGSGLLEWKHRKGFNVTVTPLSDIDNNPSYNDIKNYISDAYYEWDVRPEYILLVGDANLYGGNNLPSKHVYIVDGDGVTDNFYTFVDGDDYFPEMFIGRIPINEVDEMLVVIEKTLSYERDTYMDETEWYTKAVCSAGMDPYGQNFVSSRLTNLLIRDMLLDNGFTQVDTSFSEGWDPPTVVVNAINDGVGYVNYRGWGDAEGWTTPRFDIYTVNSLHNGPMYPLMTVITCGTGNFEHDVCLGEAWLMGGASSSNINKGGVSFIGNSNWNSHTKWNNAIDAGLYWGLFEDEMVTVAQAQLFGKMTMYNAFPNDRTPNRNVELYFNTYNIQGDPELNLYTTTPRTFDLAPIGTIIAGTNYLHLDITEGTLPIEGAMVCALKDGEIWERIYSDENGNVEIPLTNLTNGTLKITVTKRNFAPVFFDINVASSAKYVGLYSHTIDDSEPGGNGDGIINPGETFEISITVKNFGVSETANSVTLYASSLSEYLTVESGNLSFGDIPSGQTVTASGNLLLSTTTDCPHNVPLMLKLEINSETDDWESLLKETSNSYHIVTRDLIIDDSGGNSNGILDPNESAFIYLNIKNEGTVDAIGLTAEIDSPSDYITILDGEINIADLAAGDSIMQTAEAFSVFVQSEIFPGAVFNFPMHLVDTNEMEQNNSLGLVIGTVRETDPIGPDSYGYYCFDDTDVAYSEHPEYNWVEIDETWDEVIIYDDRTEEISLPFTFRYYGQDYNVISLCDNGYVALGSTWWANFYNTNIPAVQNAHAQISGLWNDFKGANDRTYVDYKYDSGMDVFLIAWDNQMFSDNFRAQTFQIILYNPETYPTITGDGIIVYQYNDIQSYTSTSVGITSPDKRDGIEYYFDGNYPPGSAGLIRNGRAIKFTTSSGMTPVNEEPQVPVVTALKSNYPNPFNNSTTISFDLAEQGVVRIDIFNLMGQRVETLLNNKLEAGSHDLSWNASNQTSGVYFVKLSSNDVTSVKKAVLIK
ncbi:MAG: T9SS type A sorting domain-containing protein [candidate division Zixibacteria bacterium]|nr:T9SS type A sorting domain-containing protein [candidate division Zixibacteria bacterium]